MRGVWGRKIGMTQIFSDENKVVPVTAIDISNWYITNTKIKDKDGYSAIQVGCVKSRYSEENFSKDWLLDPKKYFSALREIRIDNEIPTLEVGQQIDLSLISQGDIVDILGITKGAGFQGVVKRHGFTGGRASHGATFGRFTGSLSYMRSRGRVEKGKGMPGRMGNEKCTVKKLEVVKIESAAKLLLVKGSVPGKSGSLVFIKKTK